MENYPLRSLILAAYSQQPAELSGGPAWIASARYDITAKAEEGVGAREMCAAMQTVLEERFRLKMHREEKEFPVFSLSIGKSGKLAQSREESCVRTDPTAALREPAPDKPVVWPCGSIRMPITPGGAVLEGGRVPMSVLASRLTDLLGRPVVDKTGFTGTFDFT